MDKVETLIIGNFIVKKTDRLKPKIISLVETEEYSYLLDSAKQGNINSWTVLFDEIIANSGESNIHTIDIVFEGGHKGRNKISIPLVKELFSGPLQNDLINYIAITVNNYASELGSEQIFIGSSFNKMEQVVCDLIKNRVNQNFPKLSLYANGTDNIEMYPLSKIDNKRKPIRYFPNKIGKITNREGKGKYIGVDVGASNIKVVLMDGKKLIKSKEMDTTYEGGEALGNLIKQVVLDVVGDEKIDGIGIAFPGIVRADSDEILWLMNYEYRWMKSNSGTVTAIEYTKLKEKIEDLKKTIGAKKMQFVNDASAAGISFINTPSFAHDAVVVTLGTGIGASRVEKGTVDISRIEQSGAFAVDSREEAKFDSALKIKGSLAQNLRDENGELIKPGILAMKLVSWFKTMNSMNGDKHFILTGGVVSGAYGKNLMKSIDRILILQGLQNVFEIELMEKENIFSGAIGAAQLSMKDDTDKKISEIHRINMELIPVKKENRKVVHLIDEKLLPLGMINTFRRLLVEIYNEYPFLKEDEEIRLVQRTNINRIIGEMNEANENVSINVALNNIDDINELPEGVKALLFTGIEENIDFIHLEGIIGALRALEAGNIPALIRLFKLLSGKDFDFGNLSDKEFKELMAKPKEFAKIFKIQLKPAIELTDIIVLKRKLFSNIKKAA